MASVSPIAEYLRINKAIPKHDKFGTHFYSPEGAYLGRLTKSYINNYKIISLKVFGEGMKTMYTKSIAYGQQYAYIKNIKSPLGLSLVPVKTYQRKIFVDFFERTSDLEDSEKKLENKLNLIALDETTGVGLFDTTRPFTYITKINKTKHDELKHPQFTHTVN